MKLMYRTCLCISLAVACFDLHRALKFIALPCIARIDVQNQLRISYAGEYVGPLSKER